MREKVEELLNKRFKELSSDLENFPLPSDDHVELRRFSYKLGQHDLLIELLSTLGLKNPNLKELNNG